MGLIVLLNYKASTELPTRCCAVGRGELRAGRAEGQRTAGLAKAGIALDVAHVMAQRYKTIRGAFTSSASTWNGRAARRTELSGSIHRWVLDAVRIYRPVQSSNGGFYNPKFAKPDPKALGVAKTHPFWLASFERSDQWIAGQIVLLDGFKLIKFTVLTKDQFTIPITRPIGCPTCSNTSTTGRRSSSCPRPNRRGDDPANNEAGASDALERRTPTKTRRTAVLTGGGALPHSKLSHPEDAEVRARVFPYLAM
jgi:hypothetical protein